MNVVRWDPFREMEVMAENPGLPAWVPIADVAEGPNDYLVRLELPGLAADDVKVSVDDHVLSIAGERKQRHEKDMRYHHLESAHGSFLRRFRLPDDVDEEKLRADFKDGILSLHVPKSEHAKPRTIEVQAA